MKRLFTLLIGLSVLLGCRSAVPATFNLFSPADGVLVGNSNSFVTTSANALNILSLWGGTCDSSSFLRGDGTCAVPTANSPSGPPRALQYNDFGAFGGSENLTWIPVSRVLNVASDTGTTGTILLGNTDGYLWGGGHLRLRSGVSDSVGITFSTGNPSTTRFYLTPQGAWSLAGNQGTNGQVLTSHGTGAPPTWETVSGGGSSPAGSDTQIQFNNSGSFGASGEFRFGSGTVNLGNATSGSNGRINLGGSAGTATLAAGSTLDIEGTQVSITGDGATSLVVGDSGSDVVISSNQEIRFIADGGLVNFGLGNGGGGSTLYSDDELNLVSGGSVTIATGGDSDDRLTIDSDGAFLIEGNAGAAGQALISSGTGDAPAWGYPIRVASARLQDNTGTCSIGYAKSSGASVTSCTHSSTGQITFVLSGFTDLPVCVATVDRGSAGASPSSAAIDISSTTAGAVTSWKNGALANADIYLSCSGG